MVKKNYLGLKFEVVSLEKNEIGTTAIPESGCWLAAITNFTSDQDNTPVPFGQCWVPNSDYYGLDWRSESGEFIP